MNFFPVPYPDEILYSTLARYCMRSGNVKDIYNFEDLFGTKNSLAVMELPTQLGALIDNMPLNTKYSVEYFIYKHTLFPFYAAFLPEERAYEVLQSMRSSKNSLPYNKVGLLYISLNKYFRFCPKCFKEDIELYGEPYWHRLHQITGVYVCSKHQTPLHNCTDLIRGGNRRKYTAASHKNCILKNEISYSHSLIEKMFWMTTDVDLLLNNQFGFKNTEWFRSQFRFKLIEKGYAKMNNFVHQKKLRQDFVKFYGQDYLNLVQSPITENTGGWLLDLVERNSRVTFAARYLLLARFLDINVKDLFTKSLGISDDHSNYINDYQKLWDKRLKELNMSGLSIREISDILKSSRNTIRKSLDRLEIEPNYKYSTGGKYHNIKYTDTEDFKIKREINRKEWVDLHTKNKSKSSNQIRKNNYALYNWLRKYDREWFDKNYRRTKRVTNSIDWNIRDAELLPKVVKVVKEMEVDKPERITWLTIGSKLGINGWFYKGKEKLPLTKAYVEPKIESLNEYRIRKIKWGIKELEKQGRNITLWNLSEISGVKPKYMKNC